MEHVTRIGPAGWSYKDWEGIVYPVSAGSKFDQLAFIARYFDTVEVNSSFYRIPPPAHALSWVRRVAANENFRFTAKLYRGFTHERDASAADREAFKSFLDPLAESGRLGALLIQFPWSFKEYEESIDRLGRLLGDFSEYPRAVEVRHRSFQNDDFHDFLAENGAGFVNIDQPLFSDSIEPSGVVTANPAYVRLHGRNYRKWFSHAESWERYDYLYSPAELAPWVDRIHNMASEEDVYVVTNNHFRGQAVANAIELKRAIGQTAEVPPTLAAAYPDRFGPPA
jgi:uncharacterized protein YecE (DUF72 family)